MIIRSSLILSSFILLSACGGAPVRDYESSGTCIAKGYSAGTKAYDDCVKQEGISRAMQQQRDDYERQKRDAEMWKMRRY